MLCPSGLESVCTACCRVSTMHARTHAHTHQLTAGHHGCRLGGGVWNGNFPICSADENHMIGNASLAPQQRKALPPPPPPVTQHSASGNTYD